MRPPDQGPLEAILLDDLAPTRPTGSWRTWLLAIAAFAAFLGCSGLGLWGLATLRQIGRTRDVSQDALHYQWETPDQRLASIAAAMNAGQVGCSANELREITRLFSRVIESLSAGDQDAFRELVDRKAFARRASFHPLALESKSFDRWGLEDQLEWDLEGPGGWSQFSIVHVVWGPRRDEAVVYAVFAEEQGSTTPFRWWLRRNGRAWLICDWEDLDYGYPQAGRWALHQVINEHSDASEYWEVSGAPHRAYEAVDRGDLAAARRELKGQREKPLPPPARDMVWLEMAFAWRLAGRPDEALATVEQIAQPEFHAGIEYLKALVFEEADDLEQALAAAQRYRSLAGCHPELLQIEARALEALGRQSEAADCWWELTRLLPEKSHAIVEFGRLADDAQRPKIEEALSRARRPVELAVAVGEAAARQLDDPTTDLILRWLREQPAGKLQAILLEATRCEQQEDHAQAIERYRAARKLAKRTNEVEAIEERLLQSLLAADQVLAAYQELPDPRGTFERMLSGIEDDEALISQDDLPPLVAAHAEREPADPQLKYAQALLLVGDRKYAEATQALVEGEKLTGDEELLALMRGLRAECLYRQDKISDALEAGEDDPSAMLRKLAWLGRFDEDWERHDRLLASYGERQGDDPWLSYFRALRKQDQGRATEALAALQGLDAGDDTTLEFVVGRLKGELLKESKNLSQAYTGGGEPKEAFASLVVELEQDRDWEGVLALTQIHAAIAPSDPAALYYASLARWHKQDYAGLAAGLTPWPTARLQEAEVERSAKLAEWRVRSHLRLGQVAEARAAALQAQTELGEDLPLLLVEQHENRAEAVRSLLGKRSLAQSVFQESLLHDPELGGLLTDPAFADLRHDHPFEWPLSFMESETRLVLLVQGQADWQQTLDAVGSLGGGSADVDSIESPPHDPSRRAAVVRLAGNTIVLTSADRAYSESEAFAGPKGTERSIRAAAERHTGWLGVDVMGPLDGPGDAGEKLAQQAVARLCDDALTMSDTPPVVYVNRAASGSNYLFLVDDATRKELHEGALLARLPDSRKESIWLAESASEPAEEKDWLARRRELLALAKSSRVESTAGYGRVRVQLHRGHASEDLWLKVVRSRRGQLGDETLIAELMTGSALWPHLQPGARLRVDWYQVLDLEPAR